MAAEAATHSSPTLIPWRAPPSWGGRRNARKGVGWLRVVVVVVGG